MMKNTIIRIVAMLLCVNILSGCMSHPLTEEEMRKLPMYGVSASFVYNIHDPREAVGICDYVFVGKVISYDGVRYRHPTTESAGFPYTDYSVQVEDNIKGKLITNEPIHIVKEGGVTQDGKRIYIYENDEMPETGKKYVFLCYAQSDGSLLVSGPESNVPVSDDSAVVTRYEDAYKNEIIPELAEEERYHSVYEE